ncbi:carbon-nitrogen hydrolase [Mycena pura]|uniref:Carbon-nitrogen hydrolase n=1 Tax=Mycena pura TaxID=153505 RepID=A0AAD7E2X0_9AGAR|nr:carbon-nitrogen hydrolase [Mycena pura]
MSPLCLRIAAVQAEPVWLNLQGGVDKTISIIKEAAREGAKIIGFPEVFIPGYPWTPWANNFVVTAAVLKQYQANALALHSPEMDRIREAVKEADVTAVVGFAERDGASLYIAQATILPNGKIANHRRKIKATQSIHNVVQTPYGRLGSLNCWEHIQPWFKTHFYSQHPQIFVGAWWPAFPPGTGGSPYIVSGEASSRMTQMVAMEGGCFGLACCHVIYGPDGSTLAKAADPGVEEIVYAEISLSKIDEVKLVADIMGNYSRMDLLHTVAHGKNWDPIEYKDDEADAAGERAGAIDNFTSGTYSAA